MRNDIYVGVLVSVGLHCGLAFINRPSIPVTVRPSIEEKVICLVQRPEETGESPPEVSDENPAPQETLARPTLDDLPREMKIGDFPVRVQPPQGVPRFNRGMITIPGGTRELPAVLCACSISRTWIACRGRGFRRRRSIRSR